MANVEDMLQMWETINAKSETKLMKAISKDDHEFLELKDKHGNKFEIKYFPKFHKEDK